MSETFFRTALLDDRETEIEFEIAVNNWGEPMTRDHPGCGLEVEIIDAWLLADAGNAKTPNILDKLTDAERGRIELEFLENPPEADYDD